MLSPSYDLLNPVKALIQKYFLPLATKECLKGRKVERSQPTYLCFSLTWGYSAPN